MKIVVTHGTTEYPPVDSLKLNDKVQDLVDEIKRYLGDEYNFELQFQGSPIPESDYSKTFKSIDFSSDDINHIYVTLKNIGGRFL